MFAIRLRYPIPRHPSLYFKCSNRIHLAYLVLPDLKDESIKSQTSIKEEMNQEILLDNKSLQIYHNSVPIL